MLNVYSSLIMWGPIAVFLEIFTPVGYEHWKEHWNFHIPHFMTFNPQLNLLSNMTFYC